MTMIKRGHDYDKEGFKAKPPDPEEAQNIETCKILSIVLFY